jgi:hypothetical protein
VAIGSQIARAVQFRRSYLMHSVRPPSRSQDG